MKKTCDKCFGAYNSLGQCSCTLPPERNEVFQQIYKCELCGEQKNIVCVGRISTNGQKYITWLCEDHYFNRLKNMGRLRKDLCWLDADPAKVPNPDVVMSLVKNRGINDLVKSLLWG